MKKFLVLTAISGKKDKLKDPPTAFENCNYLAFVEEIDPDIKIWNQQVLLPFSSIDCYENRRNAKIYKILSTLLFPSYSYIIWSDGTHQLNTDPAKIIQEYGDADMYVFTHFDRACIYQEMQEIINLRLDNCSTIHQQYSFYKRQDFPENFGLYELSSFIKKNTNSTKRLEMMWWEQICKFSSRDQCSFPFCLWMLKKQQINIKVALLKGCSNGKHRNQTNLYFNEQYHLIL